MTFGAIHIWRPWKVFNFRDHPPLLCPATKILPSHDLGRPIANEAPLPLHSSPNDNQSVKRKHNLGMTLYVIRSFLQVDLTSFHLAEANLVSRAIFKNLKPLFCFPLIAKICARSKLSWSLTVYFSWLFILVCVVV